MFQQLAIGLALLAASADAQAQGGDPVVTVDLASGVIVDSLPFDITFVMRGPVQPETTAVRGWYIQAPEDESGEGIAACPAFNAAAWISPLQPWRRVTAAAPGATEQFRLHFARRRLEVNRFYCFRFEFDRRLSAEEESAARVAFQRAIDRVVMGLGDRASFRDAELLQLQRELISAIERASNGLRVTAPDNSVFDQRLSDQDIVSIVVARLQPVLSLQSDLASRMRNFDSNLTAADVRVQNAAALPGARQVLDAADLLDADRQETLRIVANVGSGGFRGLRGIADRRTALAQPAALEPTINDLEDAARRLRILVDGLRALNSSNRLNAAAKKNVSGLADEVERLSGLVESAQGAARTMRDQLVERGRLVRSLADELVVQASSEVALTGTTSAGIANRRKWHMSMDIGLAYSVGIGEVFPYVGTNLYFRPVNRDARLSDFRGRDRFWRSVSALVGVTYGNDPRKTGERLPLFNDRLLVVGGGLRINDSLRLASGVLLFKAVSPNPLIDRVRIDTDWFVSFSFDWDIRGDLGELGSTFGTNRP